MTLAFGPFRLCVQRNAHRSLLLPNRLVVFSYRVHRWKVGVVA